MDKLTDISQLTDESLKILKASTISDFINTKIQEANTKFEALQAEKKKVDEGHTTLTSQLAEASQKIETLQKSFDELDKREKERLKIEVRNVRVAALDDTFNLSNEDRHIIIADIENLSDEDFTKYEGKLKVLLKGKERQKVSTASVVTEVPAVVAPVAPVVTNTPEDSTKTVSTVLDAGKTIVAQIPNAAPSKPESLTEKMAKNFGLNNGIKLAKREFFKKNKIN